MTPSEFKEARQQLGLSQRELGDLIDTNPVTIRKWETDDKNSSSRKPNPVASKVMRWLLDGFRPPEFPTPNKGADECVDTIKFEDPH